MPILETKEDLQKSLNVVLNAQRQRLGFTNDLDFARYLGVSGKTLSFWRNGRWLGADCALIRAIFENDVHKTAA